MGILETGNSAATEAVADHLLTHESDEARALGYFQRLNLAGLDVKGQLSAAYGQAGVGIGGSIKADFGKTIAPFLTLSVKGDIAGERLAHALSVVQRLPVRAWAVDNVSFRPPAAADSKPGTLRIREAIWRSRSPLAVSFLEGTTYKLSTKVAGKAWAGIGSDADSDETGMALGIGVDAMVGGGGTLTMLRDEAPRHFAASPYDSGLAEYVDDLFFDNLKRRVAGWLLLNGVGAEAATKSGMPVETLETIAGELASPLSAEAKSVIDGFDKAELSDPVDAVIGSGLLGKLKSMGERVKKAVDAIGPKRPLKTEDLLRELEDADKSYESWLEMLADNYRGSFAERPDDPDQREMLRAAAEARRREILELSAALKRRRAAKQAAASKAPSPTPNIPPVLLNVTVIEGQGSVAAGAKASLTVLEGNAAKTVQSARRAAGRAAGGDAIKLDGALSAEAAAQSKRTSLRFQAAAVGTDGRVLITSQDAVLTYMNWQLKAGATAAGASKQARRANWVTMSYRAVIANWFDDLQPLNQEALPSGSGVAFGLSILSPRFAVYQEHCGLPGASVSLPEDAQATETAIAKQLRLTPVELRSFMQSLPEGLARDLAGQVDALVVESSFAFTKPVPIQVNDHRPDNLFELKPVEQLVQGKRDVDGARLQIVRLRFRLADAHERRRSFFSLGWKEPEDDGAAEADGAADGAADDTAALTPPDTRFRRFLVSLQRVASLPDQLKSKTFVLPGSLTIERLERVGSEGLVELHRKLYPPSFDPETLGVERARELEDRFERRLAETWVPGVVLFSQ